MSDPVAARSLAELTALFKAEAARLGFDAVGIAPAVVPAGYPRFLEWLNAGNEAGMAYMRGQAEARRHPDAILDGVRSVVMVAIVYGDRPDEAASTTDPRRGKVARYAQGEDYHEVLWRRLERLLDWLRTERPEVRGRAVADTAPLLERDYAQHAGLGWIGKNTMLIGRRIGTYSLLGALLLDLELAYDAPHAANHCGTCTRCLDACPTQAFDGPYRLDANRCLSYWTIEHRGAIPDEYAEQLDGWAFGCDICQDVCPWNRKAIRRTEAAFAPIDGLAEPDLIAWLEAEPAELRRQIKGTALSRAKRTGLVRNASLILGARGVAAAVPALTRLLDDPDPTVSGAAAWALGRIGDERNPQAPD